MASIDLRVGLFLQNGKDLLVDEADCQNELFNRVHDAGLLDRDHNF